MGFFEQALEAKVMSTHLLIRANVSKNILLEAYKIAKDFESRYSAYKEESFISQINRVACKQRISCEPDDMKLFKRCLEVSKKTDGEFDISMGALTHGAYHFGFANEKIPQKKLLQRQQELVDFNSIELKNNTIFLEKEGMRLDLGGIGKGYVAKLIGLFLQKKGATKALVDVGGEIVSFGKSYTLAIKDPFEKGNLAYLTTSKEPLSISTSGDYERYIESKETNHILNKQSATSPNLYSSMSIIQNGFEIDMLDAYATAMFNKDLGFIKSFAKKENFGTIIIDKESNIIFNNTRNLELKMIELAYD